MVILSASKAPKASKKQTGCQSQECCNNCYLGIDFEFKLLFAQFVNKLSFAVCFHTHEIEAFAVSYFTAKMLYHYVPTFPHEFTAQVGFSDSTGTEK